MATVATVWPEGLQTPQALKDWIADLYSIIDSKDPDSGNRLAALYSANAVVYGLQGKSEGISAIIASRKRAWDAFSSRKHEVLQVFCGKVDFSEIALVGKLTAVLKNGNEVATEFVAHITYEGDVHREPKGVLYKVWGDSAPWVKAMQN